MFLDHLTFFFFFFNDTATTEIYTLSLHDALPILKEEFDRRGGIGLAIIMLLFLTVVLMLIYYMFIQQNPDRKSTRLNSSHSQISYAVFCLKKKKNKISVKQFTHK